MKTFLSLAAIVLLISSCQKELVDPTGTSSGSGGSGSGGGSSNGELLVKGVSVTGTDTTIITLAWDSNKRLTQYTTSGKTNGTATNTRINITRETNGNIKKMISLPAGSSGYLDSVVTYVSYQSGSSKINYIKDINYTSVLGNYSDSVLITYNAAGKISVKETYLENFITGVFEKSLKSNYTYDAQGNLLTNVTSNATNGVYTPATTITNTYDSHLSPANIGDDAFVITALGEEAVSVNNIIKKVQTGSGFNLTITMSQQQFNSLNRSTSGVISVTPVPPGYTLNYTYFYQ